MKFNLIIVGVISMSIAMIDAIEVVDPVYPVDPIATSTSTTPIPAGTTVCYNIDDLLPFCPTCNPSCPCYYSANRRTKIYAKDNSIRPPFCPLCPVIYNILPACWRLERCTPALIQSMINEA